MVAMVTLYADKVVEAVLASVSKWAAHEQNPRGEEWGDEYSAIIAPIESLLALLSSGAGAVPPRPGPHSRDLGTYESLGVQVRRLEDHIQRCRKQLEAGLLSLLLALRNDAAHQGNAALVGHSDRGTAQLEDR